MTGKATPFGSLGGGLTMSGDLVSVKGLGTFATVTSFGGNDSLASLDMRNAGKAKVIGDTGQQNLFGLGFWKSQMFGFSEESQIVTLDPKTGKSKVTKKTNIAWWGAGVTTWAPVIIQ